MYKKVGQPDLEPENFEWPLNSQLSADNRWIKMACWMPWSEFEEEYAMNFSDERGSPALPFRMALGALIIKEKLGVSEARNSRTNKGKPLSTILYRSKLLQQ